MRFGQQKRYQDWFQRQYLSTPDSQSLRCDLIRYICGVVHPSNEVLSSDVLPRWAIIGWLLTTCTVSGRATERRPRAAEGPPPSCSRVPRPRRAPSRSLPAGLSAFTPPLLEISVPRNFSCTFLPVWGGGGRARPRSARQSPSPGGGSVRQKPHTAFCLNCPFSGPGLCSPAPDAQQHPPAPPRAGVGAVCSLASSCPLTSREKAPPPPSGRPLECADSDTTGLLLGSLL